MLAKHIPDKNWDINEFFNYIRKNGVSWRRIFWKIWGRLKDDECLTCGDRFVFSDIDHCTYHPEPPRFTYGSNVGTYDCCGSEAIRFGTKIENDGCRSKSHRPRHLKDDSLEAKFLEKHRELLGEPVKLSGKELRDTEDNKTETGDENNEDQIATSQSNAAEVKSQRRKMRLMSLMQLLRDFTSTKSSKFS